ncbi:RidA family protein [Nissabacter sp. SGAir0207]|nr:RidA family protein [Nissabacter sp. SGAir0207]
MIERLGGGQAGRSRAAAWKDLVWAVATSPDLTLDGPGQMRAALEALENTLRRLGSDKGHILSVHLFLANMADKAQVDSVWNQWIGDNPEHWPQRACLGVDLGGQLQVELTVTAVRRDAVT